SDCTHRRHPDGDDSHMSKRQHVACRWSQATGLRIFVLFVTCHRPSSEMQGWEYRRSYIEGCSGLGGKKASEVESTHTNHPSMRLHPASSRWSTASNEKKLPPPAPG